MKIITEVPNDVFSNKRVLARCGFNVPLSDAGEVLDQLRVTRMIPTITHLKNAGAKVIILAHIGRDAHETLKPVSDFLQQFVTHTFVPGSCIGPGARAAIENMNPGDVVMLENVRQDEREQKGDPSYAQEIASLGDIYVNDAFPDDHRAHASVTGVPALLPHYCGSALAKEIEHLKGAFTPELHSIAIIGGAKFETKEPLIRQLLLKYETVCLGGALANDLLKARGFPVGKSLIQDGGIPEDLKINQHLKHPIDVVVERAGASATCMIADVQAEDVIVDVGPQTVLQMKVLAEAAPLVVWNGPLGWYEKGYTQSSRDFGNILAYVKGETIIGGGDTIAVLDRDGFSSEKAFTFVSAGGGAMLDFLVEGTLPGIAALA